MFGKENKTVVNPNILTFHPEMVAHLYHSLGFSFLSEKRDAFGDTSPYAKAGTDPIDVAVVPFWITGEHPGELEHHLFQLQELGNALKHEEHGHPPRA
ncbi:hypothetical protein HY031_01195, partial [Candidatus Gottesmanbacteria bacterium]|nr:hypothetical protein [Candidatus Gottesmanbacteria bacterium]